MAIGKLWKFFGSKTGMAALGAQLALVILFASLYSGYHSSGRCVQCHADKTRMARLGYPQFVMTLEQVRKEARHPNTECRDCHLGNGLSDEPAGAHRGMPRVIVLDGDFNSIPRKDKLERLMHADNDRLRGMLPRLADGSIDDTVGTIMYQDRNPATYGYDPRFAEKTCGRAACHPDQVKQYSLSVMGSNLRQRSMRHWTDIHGPNN